MFIFESKISSIINYIIYFPNYTYYLPRFHIIIIIYIVNSYFYGLSFFSLHKYLYSNLLLPNSFYLPIHSSFNALLRLILHSSFSLLLSRSTFLLLSLIFSPFVSFYVPFLDHHSLCCICPSPLSLPITSLPLAP